MADLRMFLSSNYTDLKDIRETLSDFIRSYGYVPVTFEKGDIVYNLDSLIEDSCYQAISECSLFILIIRQKFGSFSRIPTNVNKSVTQIEYNVARKLGIPIFVFVYQDSLSEYNVFASQGHNKNFTFRNLENIYLARFIEEIFEDKSFRFIHCFNGVDDIKEILRKQWAGLFQKYLKNAQKYNQRANELVSINAFKVFYFRRSKGLSIAQLSTSCGISQARLQSIEDVGLKKSHIDIPDFYKITQEELSWIANSLGCTSGNLKAGLPDDFITHYLSYYYKNKGTHQRRSRSKKMNSVFKTKVVVFDFDGTLTLPMDNLTTWEKIWLKLGYELKECGELHRQYSSYQITHHEWCQLTESKFKAKNLSNLDLDEVSGELKLVEGTEEVIKHLVEQGIILYICSGSIDYIVKKVLGTELFSCFEEVKSNKFLFDEHKKLKSIVGTKYDFEGKADYINQIVSANNINAFEVLFVGNSLNDEWAHQSGAMTLCVNPSLTNHLHPFYWTNSIRNLTNLKEIYEYITF